jgi:hypothetical protein
MRVTTRWLGIGLQLLAIVLALGSLGHALQTRRLTDQVRTDIVTVRQERDQAREDLATVLLLLLAERAHCRANTPL